VHHLLKLGTHRLNNPWVVVAHIQNPDPTNKIDIGIPIHIPYLGILGTPDHNRVRIRNTSWNGGGTNG
jgi:hypothetical protein